MHAIIVIPTIDLSLQTTRRHNLPVMGHAVLEGYVKEDVFRVVKIVDHTSTNDTRTPHMASDSEGLLPWQMRELFALHLADASADLYGAVHLLTFNGEVIFS